MKSQIGYGFFRTWAWIFLISLLWYGAVSSRERVIDPFCVKTPMRCARSQLPEVDQPAVSLEAPQADALSFTTQGISGILALSIPPLWHAGTVVLSGITPAGAIASTLIDLSIFAETTVLNGLLTETSHLISQRPRPFVYANPNRGHDSSNYTSFYSGHTSFAAAATFCLLLTLLARGAPAWLLGVAGITSYALVSLTGLYRVLAGRHFPTDVLAGAIAGTLVAAFVAWRRRFKSTP